MSEPPSKRLVRATERPADETFGHPLNENAKMSGCSLSEAAGMERMGVHLVRIHPGKESAEFHRHHVEEEWFFILSGRGIAGIGDEEFEVGPGDFMGFPSATEGHNLRNPHDEELVYLVGGERKPVEIAEFPRLGKVILRMGGEAKVVDADRLEPFWKADS